MDPTVPEGAALLLDRIREVETGRAGREAYDVVYGHNKLPKPLTTMTVAEVIKAGPSWTRRHGSSAAGAYQFMNATLKGLKKELRLHGSQRFDPDLQDRLGYHLLKRRGYLAFVQGNLELKDFAKRLAQEWASFPVLEPTAGSTRRLKRGQSYYAGDGLNKALVAPEVIEATLRQVKAAQKGAVQPDVPAPDTPAPKPQGKGLMALLTALWGVIARLINRNKGD